MRGLHKYPNEEKVMWRDEERNSISLTLSNYKEGKGTSGILIPAQYQATLPLQS